MNQSLAEHNNTGLNLNSLQQKLNLIQNIRSNAQKHLTIPLQAFQGKASLRNHNLPRLDQQLAILLYRQKNEIVLAFESVGSELKSLSILSNSLFN